MSMKIRNICLTVLITGACALSAHAQKLRYVPQALKGAKAVPYAKIIVQGKVVMPLAQPQVAAILERQVVAKVTREERISRLKTNLRQLEEYVRTHDNKLPPLCMSNFKESLLGQIYQDIIPLPYNGVTEPLAKRYNQLANLANIQISEEKHILEKQILRELRAQEQEAEKRAWRQVRLQDAAWKAQPEEMADPVENAEKAATLVEQQLTTPQTITDDYINQLLNFYNKLDPYGTGTIQ